MVSAEDFVRACRPMLPALVARPARAAVGPLRVVIIRCLFVTICLHLINVSRVGSTFVDIIVYASVYLYRRLACSVPLMSSTCAPPMGINSPPR